MQEVYLDRGLIYKTSDLTETFWSFKYEDISGVGSGWHAYRKRPGNDKYLAVGFWPEIDVLQYLKDNHFRLDEDDELLFRLWLKKDGLGRLLATLKTETPNDSSGNPRSTTNWAVD